jgi:hypothetical protein
VIAVEPPVGSVVLDKMGQAWQRTDKGWKCALNELVLPWRAIPSCIVIYHNDGSGTTY